MRQVEIVGVSAGREGKVTEKAIMTILEASGLSYKFYSLSNFELLTCDACNGCIESHRCVKNDELNQILKVMEQAKGILFGAPEYWEGMNAKGRSFWERICFTTRHNDHFSLQDKLGVIIGVSGDGDSNAVIQDITNFFNDAQIKIIDKLEVQGEYACFSCGYGDKCLVGGLAEIYDLPLDITADKVPNLCNQHPKRVEEGESIICQLREIGQKLSHQLNQP